MAEREFIVKEWRDEKGILHIKEVGQELVRCKECKCWHREINGNGVEYINFSKCTKGHHGNGLDFYCADGKRESE